VTQAHWIELNHLPFPLTRPPSTYDLRSAARKMINHNQDRVVIRDSGHFSFVVDSSEFKLIKIVLFFHLDL
jgi:hypothetical protein